MTEREMKEILSGDAPRRNDSKHTGIGLPNLQERIQYIYGRSYGIALSGNEWSGLRVTVRIPIDPDGGGKEVPSDGNA
jgi:sensor histidine kinase YesM